MSKICCSVGSTLGTRLPELNEVLRQPNHLGFRKLQEQFGVSKSSIERHKTRCLRLGAFNADKAAPLPVEPKPKRLLKASVAPKEELVVEAREDVPGTDAGTPLGHLGTGALYGARARVRESAKLAQSHEDRVNWVLSQMALGQWDGVRDGWWLRRAWDLDRAKFEALVGEAERAGRRDRGEVEALRIVSLGRHAATYDRLALAFEDAHSDEAKAKIGAAMTAAAVAWDRAGGVLDDAPKVQVNFGTDPGFRQAAERYVAKVQGVLSDAEALVERVRARLGADVSLEVIAAVLSEADASIVEEVQPGKPALLTTGETA